jgi:hypothetical protein
MTEEDYNWKLYEDNKEYNIRCDNARWAVNDFSDKWLMTLAAGSFGISFTFIDKLVPLAGAVCKPLLIAAWLCFVLVIVLELISMDVSAYRIVKAVEEEGKNLLMRYQGKEPEPVEQDIRFDTNRVFGYMVLPLFVAGIFSLIIFVAKNIL